MEKFNIKNPSTNRVWKLQELHDAYSDSQKKVKALESTTSLEYSWSRICKEGRILIQKQIAAETRAKTFNDFPVP